MARRRRNQLDSALARAGVALILFAVVIAVIEITRGLILLLLAAIAAVWFVRRRSCAQRDRERSTAYRDYQIMLAAELGSLLAVTATDFEQIVGTVLEAHGYREVQHVGRTRDRGIDVRCVDRFGRRTVVQCKQYGPSNKISGPAVRNLIGAASQDRAQHAMLVTTSSFTAEAIAAGQSSGMDLIDGATFVSWARAARATHPTVDARPAAP